MALLDDIRKSEYLSLLGDKLQGLLDLPTSAARFMVNPTAFVDATTGKTAMPKEVGFAEGAAGLPQRENLTVLDPRNRSYMEGYQTGEPFSYAAMASPMVGAGATKLSDKLVQTITGNPMATGSKVIDYASAFSPSQIFIGASAKNFDKKAAFEASKMEKAGKTAEEIWQKTGTARFADGQWRQEISDAEAKMIAKPTKEALSKNPNIQDVMAHPELYQSYDEMLATKLKPQEGYAGGSYESATGNIGLKPLSVLADWRMSAFKDPKIKTLLHESQHKIQGIEDWGRGGGYDEFTQQAEAEIAKKALMIRDEIDRLPNSIPFNERAKTVKELFEKLDQTPIDDTVMQVVKDYKDNSTGQLQKIVDVYGLNQRSTPYSPEEMYSRLAGEAESRLTERRFKLSPEERVANFPYSYGTDYGLDIPMDRLLVRTDAGYVNTPLKDLIEQGLLGK